MADVAPAEDSAGPLADITVVTREHIGAETACSRTALPPMSDEPVLLCSDHNGVRTLTLNRPHRKNAINRDLWIALADALAAAGNDRACVRS